MSSVQRVELQPGVAIPLPTKGGSVIIRGNKPWDATQDRELARALRTPQRALRDLIARLLFHSDTQSLLTSGTHQPPQKPSSHLGEKVEKGGTLRENLNARLWATAR